MTINGLKPGQHGEIFIAPHAKKWRAKVRVRLFDGSETQVSRVGPTGEEARLRVQDAVAERLGAPQGSMDLKPDSKVGAACRQWINELRVRSGWANPQIRPQTVDEYERLLGNHVVPRLGKLRLNELTPARCQAWVDGIVARGQGKKHDLISTTISARGAFIAVLDRAVVHDALRDNPVRKTIPPAKKRPDPKAMTTTDVYRLRAAVRAWEASRMGQPGPKPTGHLPVAVDVMLGTGMRIGEVMALRWGEVNLSPDGLPTISVEATLADVKGQGTVRQAMPKTDAGERTIIIPAFLAASLESIRPAVTTAEMPVFPSRRFRDGRNVLTPQTPHNIRRSLRAALEEAGMVGEVYPHLLRKTVATVVARKMGVADAAALLGHKIDGGVTGRHYIERLRLAPDTSAVLQAMVEIGQEEAAGTERVDAAPKVTARAVVAQDVELGDGSGW
ncbi:tyrosine-type recombinase/integrase [Antribacter gilvus]|uniref:tyrosine-type recombinase/integrase n=1 Tax=Antribacter gilvus TaxID=2304675 RepID=UPI000F78D76B|nr:site-specific integrase [Antribacter gilvus]